MKKVVVTGGAGFIGSHLAEYLSNLNYHVTIIDDLSTGKISNIQHLLGESNIEFAQGSITDNSFLQSIFRGVDYVFHQAAISSVPKSIENPQATHDVNVTGTLNVLKAANDNRVKKVIYASSCAIYGDKTVPRIKEDMEPILQSPYALSKLAGEYYCQVFHRAYRLPTICLRYFNIYGPKQDSESLYAAVIPRFIMRVCENNPPIILGDGEQTRDFTFIQDVINANILAAEGAATGTYNIGTGEGISINKLAELIIMLMGINVQPVYEKPLLGDIRHSIADISRSRSFGYKPKWALKEGLRETIRAFQNEA